MTPTLAAFTNAGNLTGTTFTSYTVPAPALTSCTLGGSGNNRTVTFNWTGVTSPATTYTGDPGTLTTTSDTIGGTGAAPTYALAFSTSGGSGNRGKTATITISPSLTATPSWTGPVDTGTVSISGSGTLTCSVV